MKKSIILFAIAFCLATSQVHSSEDENKNEAVVTLTSKTFDEFVSENEIALVEFYAPWCGHCKRLAPEYEKAAQTLKGEIPLAKIDATTEDSLAQKFGVNGYPTIKLFRNGKPEEYKGGRTADTIVEYLQKMTGAAVEFVKDKAAAEKAAKAVDVAFVGACTSKDSSACKMFEEVANSNRLLGKFIAYVETDVKEKATVYRAHEGHVGSIVIEDKEALETFCNEERFPFFGPIHGDNYGDYFGSGKDLVWFAGSEDDYNDNGKIIRQAAKEFRTENSFVWLDTEKFKDHAQSSLGVKEFPSLVIQTKEGRYVYPEHKFSSADKITTFLRDVAANKVEKFLMSEEIPEETDDAVKVVVGKTFKEKVLQSDKDVMLEVYAPWCGHCKKLEPIYEEFAKKMQHNKKLVIAKMDGTTNESPVPNFEWRGFPSIFFVKAGSDTPLQFDGARTLEGLTEFVKEHASTPIEADVETHDEL